MNPETACHVTAKILSAIMLLAMAAHLIRPFGLPGLRRRADFWKLAVIAFVLLAMTIGAQSLLP